MAGQGKVRRIGGITALVIVVTGGAWLAYAANTEPETRFCKASLAILEIGGEMAVTQDQGDPGRDGCDIGDTSSHGRTLGFDCKVRDPDGEVIEELEPNRDDGTCGLSEPDDDGFPRVLGHDLTQPALTGERGNLTAMADAIDVTGIEEVRDLYRIDPGEFVEARAALVKQLRAEGRKEEARAVVKLRKPSVSSWALDQVAVDQPELIEAALAAGEALQVATTETLEGDASNLRGATDAERKASAAAIDAAATHLPALTSDHRERMAATLRAAITDDEVRAQLLDGLLATDHEPPAMGFAATAEAPAARSEAPARKAAAKKTAGSAKARLAEPPQDEDTRPKRKIRRVGTPSSAKRAPIDEVDAKRRAKEVERLQAEEAERKRAEEEQAKERKRQQAALDAAATKARTKADRLEEKARRAEEAAATARAEADEAAAEATEVEAAATAGPPG